MEFKEMALPKFQASFIYLSLCNPGLCLSRDVCLYSMCHIAIPISSTVSTLRHDST